MSEYSKDYRTLSCWECFDAHGKICIDKDSNSMIRETGSSNRGHAICCKPDNFKGYCSSTSYDQHICSQPALEEDTTNEFKNVLTGRTKAGNRMNFQMFAFCPLATKKNCGINSDDADSTDLRLEPKWTSQTLSTTDLKYREGKPSYREYDACYYEIGI